MPLHPVTRLIKYKLLLVNELTSLDLNKTQTKRFYVLTAWFRKHSLILDWNPSAEAYTIEYKGKKIMDTDGRIYDLDTFKKIRENEF